MFPSGETSDAELLMRAPEKLVTAENRRGMLILGRPPGPVKGAPDRTAYWPGYLAAGPWCKANPNGPLSELLSLTPADLFAGLRYPGSITAIRASTLHRPALLASR